MNAPQGQPIEIPKEHMPHVLNSLICERMLGFERRLNEHGNFEWRGKKLDGTVSEWSEALLDFANKLDEAEHMLTQTCRQIGCGFNIIFDGRRELYAVLLSEQSADGKPVRVSVQGKQLPLIISAAIVGAMGYNLSEQHRTLYPSHYIKLSS